MPSRKNAMKFTYTIEVWDWNLQLHWHDRRTETTLAPRIGSHLLIPAETRVKLGRLLVQTSSKYRPVPAYPWQVTAHSIIQSLPVRHLDSCTRDRQAVRMTNVPCWCRRSLAVIYDPGETGFKAVASCRDVKMRNDRPTDRSAWLSSDCYSACIAAGDAGQAARRERTEVQSGRWIGAAPRYKKASGVIRSVAAGTRGTVT